MGTKFNKTGFYALKSNSNQIYTSLYFIYICLTRNTSYMQMAEAVSGNFNNIYICYHYVVERIVSLSPNV